MRKTVIFYGLMAGIIESLLFVATIILFKDNEEVTTGVTGMVVGFAAMILALSLTFVGIKNYRDKVNGGTISFARAFKIGLLISLIAATLYVITWAIVYNFVMPDFMERYVTQAIEQIERSKQSAVEKAEAINNMRTHQERYKNPFYFTLLTYCEILPVGILISLISALVLKRKRKLQ